MQVEEKQLARQQAILKHLGFYTGEVDGIWSTLTIKAKKEFEVDSSFNPGIPNNGLPFSIRPPFPKGIMKDNIPNLLTVVGLEEVPKKLKVNVEVQEEVKPMTKDVIKEKLKHKHRQK